MDSSPTSALVAAARDGDREALDSLFARHRGRLIAFLQARTRESGPLGVTADDLGQECLLEASRKLGTFQPQGPSSFYRWLVAIGRFKLSEAIRGAKAMKRTLETLEGEPAARQTSPSGVVLRDERATRLHAALATLPEAQAEAVTLRWLEGLTIAETAERLERSEAAVKALVARGLAALSEALERS